nr:PREDICTED: ras-related protein Rab-39B [Struthio camelus australis]
MTLGDRWSLCRMPPLDANQHAWSYLGVLDSTAQYRHFPDGLEFGGGGLDNFPRAGQRLSLVAISRPRSHHSLHAGVRWYRAALPSVSDGSLAGLAVHARRALAGCNSHVSCGSFFSRSITRAYYRNSVGGLLLFDITNRRSFQNVHEWLEETKVHVQPYQIVFVLVGHKCDLDTQRQVTRHEAEKLAAAYGMKYIETSARDAINVEKAFTDLTRDIYELVKRGDISIQEGWEGVKSGFVPNVVHSSEEVVKSDRRCLC